MSQVKLLAAEKAENGIKITFLNENNETVTGIYNNGNLSLSDIQKLIGNRIALNDANKQGELHITKAWNDNNTPTFCDDVRHGMDR